MNCKHPNPVNLGGVINQSSSSIIAHINSSVGNSTTFQSTRTIRIKRLQVVCPPVYVSIVSPLWPHSFPGRLVVQKEESSAGLEPATSRLTVERANQLRHEDLRSSAWQVHFENTVLDQWNGKSGATPLSCRFRWFHIRHFSGTLSRHWVIVVQIASSHHFWRVESRIQIRIV